MAIQVAQGTRSQLLSKLQSAFGTAATGNYTDTKFVTHSLKLDTQTQKSATIRSDREIADFRHTVRSAMGDVDIELDYGDHDDWLQAALFASAWSTDTLGIGTTPSYLTLEDGAADISRYRKYQDMLVSKMALELSPGAIAKASFSFVGTQMSAATSSGGGTPAAKGTNQPFDALTGAIYDDEALSGSALATVTGIKLNVDNGAKATFVVGSRNAAQLEYGAGDVSGELTVYYTANAAMTSRYLAETEFALSFTLLDPAGNSLEFQMPRVKVLDDAVPVANPQSRVQTIPFQALKPTSGGVTTALKLTRDPA